MHMHAHDADSRDPGIGPVLVIVTSGGQPRVQIGCFTGPHQLASVCVPRIHEQVEFGEVP